MKINKMTLYVKNIEALKNFYIQQLGFTLIEENATSFSMAVGGDLLSFELAETSEQNQYHFAFNIPSNQFKEAKNWMKAYANLLVNNGADEVYFESIDAHSLYFYDPEENVVELIARQTINPSVEIEGFSSQSILSIGEINLTTDDIKNVGNQLMELGIPVSKNQPLNENSLNFMGEKEDGVHILLGPSNRIWYFSDKKAKVSNIQLVVNDNLILKMNCNGVFHYERVHR